MCIAKLKSPSVGMAVFLCGCLSVRAGSGQSRCVDPESEYENLKSRILAIQCNFVKGKWQPRTDFNDNSDFAAFLRQACEHMRLFGEVTSDDTDWRPVAEAYHLAFEELRKRLQGDGGVFSETLLRGFHGTDIPTDARICGVRMIYVVICR